jgi:hypothetical protein
VRSEREELLPETLLDLPEVLAACDGRRWCDEPRRGRETTLRSACGEEEVDALLVWVSMCRGCAEELAYDLDGEDLRVGDLRRRTALSNVKILDAVVYVRQKTATMKVLRSIRRRPPSWLGRFGHHRA